MALGPILGPESLCNSRTTRLSRPLCSEGVFLTTVILTSGASVLGLRTTLRKYDPIDPVAVAAMPKIEFWRTPTAVACSGDLKAYRTQAIRFFVKIDEHCCTIIQNRSKSFKLNANRCTIVFFLWRSLKVIVLSFHID